MIGPDHLAPDSVLPRHREALSRFVGASLAMTTATTVNLARNGGDQACALPDAHAFDAAACTFVQVDASAAPETRTRSPA